MIQSEIHTTYTQVPNEDIQIDAYLAQPLGAGPFPAVVVVQEIFGVNKHIREVTEKIAKEGYVAIAPSIYQRQAPGFEVGYTEEDIILGRKYKEKTKASELLKDIQATINYLKKLSTVKSDKFGCIGFCFGGHVTYLAATLPEIQATSSFYGGGITTGTPGGGKPTITLTAKISGKIYCFFGTEDPLIPIEQVDQIEVELQKHQIKHQVFRYPASHGFFCDHRSSYNAQAAFDAWVKTKQLFAQQL